MNSDDKQFIQSFQKMSISTVVFDMKDLSDIIEEIEDAPSFENLCMNKIINNFSNWLEKNPYHDFPKSSLGWKNIIYCQFKIIKVKFNAETLYRNLDIDFSNYNVNIKIVVNRIKTHLARPKNRQYSKEKIIRRLQNFCGIDVKINPDLIFDELVKRKIIINNIPQIVSKKRRREDDEPKYLSIDSPHQFKKKR